MRHKRGAAPGRVRLRTSQRRGAACPMPWLHASSAAVFCGQLGGYVALSTALQRRYYHARAAERRAWRAQPDSPPHAPDDGLGSKARAVVSCEALCLRAYRDAKAV